MSEFTVTIDKGKFDIKFNDTSKIFLNDKESTFEVVKLSDHTYNVIFNNKVYHITTSKLESNKFSFLIDGHYFETIVRTKLEEETAKLLNNNSNKNVTQIIGSPMPGLILRIDKNIGDNVTEGESLVLLEAMKMENEIRSNISGVISNIFIKEGDSVEKNQELFIIK